jgi:hypothetical protein
MTSTMATRNVTTAPPRTPADAHQFPAADRLLLALQKLDALVVMTYGPAGDSFSDLTDSQRESYLAHCSELNCEALELAEEIVFHRAH